MSMWLKRIFNVLFLYIRDYFPKNVKLLKIPNIKKIVLIALGLTNVFKSKSTIALLMNIISRW